MSDFVVVNAQEKGFILSRLQRYTMCMPSDAGLRALKFLIRSFGGLHHLSEEMLASVNWSEDHFEVDVSHERFASYDFAYLTKLILYAHDMAIRIELKAVGEDQMHLLISPRTCRQGEQWDRHPTLEEHMSKYGYIAAPQSNKVA